MALKASSTPKTPDGYGSTYAVCSRCEQPLDKAAANMDGEPTFVGYHACSSHPNARPRWKRKSDGQYIS